MLTIDNISEEKIQKLFLYATYFDPSWIQNVKREFQLTRLR